MKKVNFKAQTIVEYVAIIIVLAAVFAVMWAYYKRGLQGRYRQAGDVLSVNGQFQYPGLPKGDNPYVRQ